MIGGLVLAVLPLGHRPAQAVVTFSSGVCTFDTMTTAFSPAASLVPAPTSVEMDGEGTCVFFDADHTGDELGVTLRGSFGLPPTLPNYMCLGGAAVSGGLSLQVAGEEPLVGNAVWAAGPAVGELAIASVPVPTFTGEGVFTRLPLDAAACEDGIGSMDWSGVIVFEDPVPT